MVGRARIGATCRLLKEFDTSGKFANKQKSKRVNCELNSDRNLFFNSLLEAGK
jgi:hypothetical protein